MNSSYEGSAVRRAADLRPPSPRSTQSWHVRTPLGTVAIAFRDGDLWTVVFEGFSRSRNRSLRVALAEATGAHHEAPWLRQLVSDLDSRACET